MEWSCSDGTACAGITAYRVEHWNATVRTYEPVASVAADPNRLYHAYGPMKLGQTSYFRITGVLTDGTPAAVVHASAARGPTCEPRKPCRRLRDGGAGTNRGGSAGCLRRTLIAPGSARARSGDRDAEVDERLSTGNGLPVLSVRLCGDGAEG
ncbi:hypothetical protein SAMN02787118_103363 [Streptomyces mirabilis]|uniref:Uncharacterized protein n=1 Tax=Streptomyces mirabilis TaxID=68239 RepID=A0A1I2F9W3_9ACTN|nr:hypothetical protein SAMN02787118_103363 [Streptomyces mirabilis]